MSWEKGTIRIGGIEEPAVFPAVISASRATDTPAFHFDWLIQSLNQGYLHWRNPFNGTKHLIGLSQVRAIVFWTKDPLSSIRRLDELDSRSLSFYFQYTLNDYDLENLEPGLPPVKQKINTFKALSDMLGKHRVVWRFDPIILSSSIGCSEIINRFAKLAEKLERYTNRVVFSFVDIERYRKVRLRLGRLGRDFREPKPSEMFEIADGIAQICSQSGIEAQTCCEKIDLSSLGIPHGKCIDDALLLAISNYDEVLMDQYGWTLDIEGNPMPPVGTQKDKGQRKNCAYCYANR